MFYGKRTKTKQNRKHFLLTAVLVTTLEDEDRNEDVPLVELMYSHVSRD